MAHQAYEPAHALFIDDVPRQTQVVAQAQHALKIMLGELRIEQAHQFQVIGTFSAGAVVETAACQAQRLATGVHRTGRVGLANQRALLGY